MRRRRRRTAAQRLARVALACAALWAVGSVMLAAFAQSDRGQVYHLELKGVINPLSAKYLARGLAAAEDERAAALVFEINTPGGLDSAMRDMVELTLNSEVPVIIYVGPAGARAASAGMFITIAAHVAAMAPGTNIGAAHPVALGGDQADETMLTKVEEDAAAYARSVAELRGRNADWAEKAVRESVSITATEAERLKVVDLVAPDLRDLLRRVDGRTVKTAAGPVTLDTAGAPVREMPMTVLERLLHTIADPNIAYILLSVGMIGIIAELYYPGSIFPGVTGGICLLLGLTALGMLPIGWAGVALLVLAMGLFVAEIFQEGFGILGVGAIIAFIFGSLLLFVPVTPVSPATPTLRVSPWLVVVMSALLLAAIVGIFRARMLMWRKPPLFGAEAMVGREGVALSDLDPAGTVRVDTEAWRAEARGDPIKRGDKVRVISVEGVTLVVEPPAQQHPQAE